MGAIGLQSVPAKGMFQRLRRDVLVLNRRLCAEVIFCGWIVTAFLIVNAGCNKQRAPEIQSSKIGDAVNRSNPGSRPETDLFNGGVTSNSLRSDAESSREATLARIDRLIAAGDLSEAERAVETHLVRYPNDPDAMMFTAQLYAARGQVDDAVSMLEQSARHSADDGKQSKTYAGVLLAQAGRWQEAIARLETLVEEHPDYDEARHRLVEWLNFRGFRFDANQHVRALCQRNQATVGQLCGLMVPARSLTEFTERSKTDDDTVIEKYGSMSVVRVLLSDDEALAALDVLKRSRLLRENHPAAAAIYGQVLLESQQFDAFESWLRDVPPQCQRYPAYWLAIGGWAMLGRNHEPAIRMFAEAILREPGDMKANDRMTQALAAAGHKDASERFRQRGIEIDGLNVRTQNLMQDSGAGLQSISQISRLLASIGRPLESLAWSRIALQRMGSPPNAMRQLDQALSQMKESGFQVSVQQNLLCGIDLDEFPLDLSMIAEPAQSTRFTPRPSAGERPRSLQPSFLNVARKVGLDFRYRNARVPVLRELLMFHQIGGGVGCIDYDLDGRVDFYVGQAAGDPPDGKGEQPNLLSRNLGDRFQEITALANCDDRGFAGGVTSGDWNQDGFPDLVVANIQQNTLFINQGDGTFQIQSGDSVWEEPIYTASVAMGDINGDHLPDIVEVNYLDDPHIYDPIEHHPDGTPIRLPAPLSFRPALDRVFLSHGDGTFSGQSLGDPDRPLAATGLGVLVTNIDGKPGNEIFVANDHMANHFWEQGTGDQNIGDSVHWRNTAAVRGLAYGASGMPLGCMGIAVADFDENGRIDFHVTNFGSQLSNQYMQDDAGFFKDLIVAFGLAEPSYQMVGFGTQAFDYDNNSVIDLVVGNGHIEDMTVGGGLFEMPTQLFVGEGSRFEPIQVTGDDGYWNEGHLTRALAYCDWNHDGRIDLVTTDLNQPLALLENRTDTDYHWIQLQLVGSHCERDAIGATIKATHGSRTITKVVQAGDGYMCKNESLVCFGLGDDRSADRVEIRWPDGHQQVLRDIAADHRWLIVEGEDEAFQLRP
jgi:tetratricopeptide (TPR) repeat protein